MTRSRALPAFLALVGLLFPWARVLSVSTHLFEHPHESSPSHHTDELEDAVHGHHHEKSEQEHGHSAIGFDAVAQRAKVVDAVTAPAAVVSPLASFTSGGVIVGTSHIVVNESPPRRASSRHVVLRI